MRCPCSSLSVFSAVKPYCRHSHSILRKRLKLGNHWYALYRIRFRLLTSCWCCSLVRLSSLAWSSFIFCISEWSLSICPFNSSTSLCSWAFLLPNIVRSLSNFCVVMRAYIRVVTGAIRGSSTSEAAKPSPTWKPNSFRNLPRFALWHLADFPQFSSNCLYLWGELR